MKRKLRLPKMLDFKFTGLRRFIAEHKKPLAIAMGLFAVGLGLRVWCESMGYGGLALWGLDLISRCLYGAVIVILLSILRSILLSKRLVVLCTVLCFATILCNGIVMGVNDGYMPTTAGIRELPYNQYILGTNVTHLNWLGDWIPGSIFGHKFAASIGDMFSVALMLVLLFALIKGSAVRFRECIKRRRSEGVLAQ